MIELTVNQSNTSGLLINERNADDNVYAVFFIGSFVNVGPMTSDGHLRTEFSSGRIVGTENDVLSIQLWLSPEGASVPFGPQLDDR